MKNLVFILSICFILTSSLVFAETFKITLEPMPPFIHQGFLKKQDPGLSVVFLKQLEKKMGVTFEFKEAPYNRLKWGLKQKSYDLVGHMPFQMEVKEFYKYAIDVDWNIAVISDIYVIKKENLSRINQLKIGTPRGNKEFAAELTGIPITQFYDSGTIDSLLGMLYKGRLDAFWFPRATTMPFIQKSGQKVYYKQFPDFVVPVCFSVQNNAKGKLLKKRIEAVIPSIDTADLFKEIHAYNKMPSEGVLN